MVAEKPNAIILTVLSLAGTDHRSCCWERSGTLLQSICGVLGIFIFRPSPFHLLTLSSCVFAEMYRRKPILQGNTDIDQLVKIFALCGAPTAKTMPGAEKLPGFDVVRNMRFQRSLELQHSRLGLAHLRAFG
jgi:hypothetical protein